MFKHILLATDGSAASEHAAAMAARLPRTHAARLTVLYVVDPYPYLVVGSHGRTGITRLVLGSVAARVVAESPVPVLVAR